METVWNTLMLIGGFLFLVKGADLFVDGSAALARHFHVSGVVIGLTIVALETSAPELAVSSVAAFQGANEIALSNVVGSNTFNLLAVLGICALIRPVPVDTGIIKRDYPFSIGATLLVFLLTSVPAVFRGLPENMAETIGDMKRWMGILTLLLFLGYIAWLIYEAKKHPEKESHEDVKLSRSILFIVIGLAMIILGGEGVVRGAKYIASACGMSETLIGLTIVAVGTSLPELVTSVVASKKGENGLAVGNVVGSNIFNLLFILGVSSTIRPMTVNLASFYDLIILLFVSGIVYIIAIRRKRLNRSHGVLMLTLYAIDVVFAVLR